LLDSLVSPPDLTKGTFRTDIVAVMWSVGIGCVTILAILVRYIQSRVRLQKFNVTYANSQSLGTQHDGTDNAPASTTQKPLVLKKNIYDRWLVTRFVIAFFILR
jgi:hypothetical protein